MKTYGRPPEAMESIVTAFITVLDGYPFDNIAAAFKEHMKTKDEMPTPADIVRLIDPPKEKLSAGLYVTLKKEIADSGYNRFVSDKERKFMRAFEDQELSRVDTHVKREDVIRLASQETGISIEDNS